MSLSFIYSTFDVLSTAYSTLSRALAWLRGSPSSTATATAVEARFNSLDARLAALSRDAHAAAHAVVHEKATYASPIVRKSSTVVCARPKRASPAAGVLRDGAEGDNPCSDLRRSLQHDKS